MGKISNPKPATREFIETIANIVGPASACAQALEIAKSMRSPAFYTDGKRVLVVDEATDTESRS